MKPLFLILFVFFLRSLPLFAEPSENPPLLKDLLLQRLIQIDTSNPPGNETEAARYIQEILLEEENVPSEIIEAEPGRGNLIARLKGDGSKPAMILLGHLDVVPADPSEWEVPPFDAVIKEGRVWGRGALDMKGMVAMELAAFRRIAREKIPLGGDLILVLCADEEAGGKKGAEFLVQNHWEKIEAAYLLNEGSVGIEKFGLRLYPIQVAEKGVAWMKIVAQGPSGHGSMPTAANAVARLAKAIDLLAVHRFPIDRSETIEAFLRRIAPHLDFPKNWALRYFFHPLVGPVIQKFARPVIERDKTLASVLSHTVSPTMLEAGYKANVIPSQAQAVIDARILPGETPEGFRDRVKSLIGQDFEVSLIATSLPNASDFKSDFFRIIEEAVLEEDSEAVTAPILSAGATDSRFFRAKGVISYGLIPFLIRPEELEGLHGKNERIPVEGLEKGARIIFEIVKKMQAKK